MSKRGSPKIFLEKPPTDMFQNCITDGGTPVATCGFCGRTHFALDGYFDEGELEDLLQKQKDEPEWYLSFDCGSIPIGELAGTIALYGCPCNALRRYENFIITERDKIVEYLKRRTEEHRKKNVADTDSLNGL